MEKHEKAEAVKPKETAEKEKQEIESALLAHSQHKDPKEKKSREEEYKEMLQRLQADFENYRKRAEKENHQAREYGVASFIRKLLPLLDSFELAFKNCARDDSFVKGIELIYAQFYAILETEGLKQIDAVGKKYDPYLHEVLMKEEGKEDGIVTEELLKGYLLKDTVLRHSKVKISEKKQPEKKDSENKESYAQAQEACKK
jgi:molecular chaperone GrpE